MGWQLKAAVSLFALVQILIFIVGGLYLEDNALQKEKEFKAYLARKEELMSQQQRMEMLTSELNSTLNYEKSKNQELAKKLSAINSQPLPQPQLSEPIAPVTPAAQPSQPVTRAS